MSNTTNHKKPSRALRVDESTSLEEQIARRAYELWQQRERDRREGTDLGDWLRAEREVAEWHEKRIQAQASRHSAHDLR